MRKHSRKGPPSAVIEILQRALTYFGILCLGIGTGAFLLAYTLAGQIYEYQDTFDGVHLPAVDAIVVLAGGRGRIAAAGDLWYRYWELAHSSAPGLKTRPEPLAKVPILYLSGVGAHTTWDVFARQLRRGVQQAIRPENAFIETESRSTEGNAQMLARYAREKRWRSILLLTSSYHMKRARFMFDHILEASGQSMPIETLSVFQEPFEPGEWRASAILGVRVTVWEYLKWVYYTTFWHPR